MYQCQATLQKMICLIILLYWLLRWNESNFNKLFCKSGKPCITLNIWQLKSITPHATINKTKRQPAQCGDIFANDMTNKGLISKIQKQLMHVYMLSHFTCVWLFVTPWTVAHQAPKSMGFPKHDYWSGLPFPPPGDLSDPGIKLVSLASPTLALPLAHMGSPGTWKDTQHH